MALPPAQPDQPAEAPAVLRAEHDALAVRLSVRTSVDQIQRGGIFTFFSVIACGMTSKLAWDRWGWLPEKQPPPPGYPLWVLLGALVTAVLLGVAVRAFRRAGALRREEDALFARLRALRARLELDT